MCDNVGTNMKPHVILIFYWQKEHRSLMTALHACDQNTIPAENYEITKSTSIQISRKCAILETWPLTKTLNATSIEIHDSFRIWTSPMPALSSIQIQNDPVQNQSINQPINQ